MAREVEAKFRFEDYASATASLAKALDSFGIPAGEFQERHEVSEYFDTQLGDLYDRGVGLRFRFPYVYQGSSGADTHGVWTIKSTLDVLSPSAHFVDRYEFERVGVGAHPPGDLYGAIVAYGGGSQSLNKVVTFSTRRRARKLRLGESWAEVVIDEVLSPVHAFPPIVEIEVEADEGIVTPAVTALSAALASVGGSPTQTTKLESALGRAPHLDRFLDRGVRVRAGNLICTLGDHGGPEASVIEALLLYGELRQARPKDQRPAVEVGRLLWIVGANLDMALLQDQVHALVEVAVGELDVQANKPLSSPTASFAGTYDEVLSHLRCLLDHRLEVGEPLHHTLSADMVDAIDAFRTAGASATR